jgi:hypothetical protein
MTQILRYDLLGVIKYKKRALVAVEPGSAIAVLDKYFDKSTLKHNKLYTRILNHHKNLTLVVHGIWHNDHKFTKKDRKKAVKIAKRLAKLQNPERVYFSPFLEHKKGKKFMEKTFAQIKAVAPDLKLVNSYITGGKQVPGVISEIHHTDHHGATVPYIFSTDGTDPFLEDIQGWKQQHKQAIQFGMWHHSFNGKESMVDSTPPLNRKAWPSVSGIQSVAGLYL